MTGIIRKFRIACMLLAVVMLVTACGEKDGKGYIFGYDISSNPQTLDPQSATDSSSLMLIDNIFEGLLKMNEDGSIVNGVTESYKVSNNGLTYTFKLRQNSYWIDVNEFETQCTAKDFVFAFQRLFDPDTRAERAVDFFCIKNAEKINKGKITDLSQLGVTAKDDFTLIIKLEYQNPSLPMLLTTAAAMPCNEKYFYDAQGRYGLQAKTTPSNGAFYLKSWNYDKWSTDNNNLVLRYNPKYNEYDEVLPLGLNFFIEDTADFLSDFQKTSSQSIVASGDDIKTLIDGKYDYKEYTTSVIGIMLNTTSKAFSNLQLCYALSYGADKSGFNDQLGFVSANAIVPNDITLDKVVYRESAGEDLCTTVDLIKAKSCFDKARASIKKEDFDAIKIITLDDENMLKYVEDILQKWQSNLGFYCNVEVLSEADYNLALKNKDYTLAVTEITGDYNSPSAYLQKFISTSSYNYSGYSSVQFEDYLKKAERADSLEESAVYYKKAEQELLSSCVFIPLVYRTEYFFLNKECEDIMYNPFTKSVTYLKAKCYD